MKTYSEIGEIINDILIEKNITQAHLAYVLGYSQGYVSGIMRGKNPASEKFLEALNLYDPKKFPLKFFKELRYPSNALAQIQNAKSVLISWLDKLDPTETKDTRIYEALFESVEEIEEKRDLTAHRASCPNASKSNTGIAGSILIPKWDDKDNTILFNHH